LAKNTDNVYVVCSLANMVIDSLNVSLNLQRVTLG